MYKIYCYTNLTNNKKYIGLTKRSLDAREVNHLSEAYNSNSPKYNTPFKQAIRKYGIKGFKREILEEVATLEEANQREQYYIQKLNTYCYQGGHGYNATLGGDGVTRPINEIVCLDSYTGKLIKTYSCISEAETELNCSHISEVIYEKLPTTAGFCWMFKQDYDELSDKERFDYVNCITKRIVQLTTNYDFIRIWDGATEASCGLFGNTKSNSNIVAAYKGRTKTAFGYIWRTYYDYIHNITPLPQKLKLYKKDEEGNILEEYETLRAMARAHNMVEQTLGRHINKGLYKGYYWTKE